MKTVPTAILTMVGILALSWLPFSRQSERMEKARTELEDLARITHAPALAERTSGRRATSGRETAPTGETGADSGKKTGIQATLTQILAAQQSHDETALLLALSSLGNLTRERFESILAEAKAHPGNKDARTALLLVLSELAPADFPREKLADLIFPFDTPSTRETLSEWSSQEPEAAFRWFLEKASQDKFAGTELFENTARSVLKGLLQTNPLRAVDFFTTLSADPAIRTDDVLHTMAQGLGKHLAKGQGSDEFALLLATLDRGQAAAVANWAAETAVPEGNLVTYLNFIHKHLVGTNRDSAILSRIDSSAVPPGERFAVARRFLPEANDPETITQIAGFGLKKNLGEVRTWVDGLPAGDGRDAGLRAISRTLSSEKSYAEAFSVAMKIADPSTRQAAVDSFSSKWLRRDEAAARAALEQAGLRSPSQTN